MLGHPFNLPHLIPLVELLGNDRTDPDASDRAAASANRGKVTIRVMKEVPAHVGNRLQAALWREAIHLVAEGVASVEDVDKAVTAGPGLRWSVMGPHMLFGLASGGGGMEEFCNRYADSFHRWWDSSASRGSTLDVVRQLAEGLAAEEAGRSFDELSALRDKTLLPRSGHLPSKDELLRCLQNRSPILTAPGPITWPWATTTPIAGRSSMMLPGHCCKPRSPT